jgi:hypothetical protein
MAKRGRKAKVVTVTTGEAGSTNTADIVKGPTVDQTNEALKEANEENPPIENLPAIDDRRLTHQNASNNLLWVPSDLYARARKAGVSDEQMVNLGSPEKLKRFCDQVSPETNPDALPKRGIVPPAPVQKKPSKIPPQYTNINRDDQRPEKSAVESFIRKINIVYDSPKMKRVVKTVVYDCEKKQIVSALYEIEQ